MSGKTVAVSQFVDSLRSLEDAPITRDRMLEFMLETRVDRKSLDPYVHFRPDMYTRNLVYRDDQIELMAVCWQPGQRTVIHTHNGQLGWMMVNRGVAEVTNFKWNGCNASEGQNKGGLDCLAGATELDLARESVEVCGRGGHVNSIDRVRTIHRVAVVGEEPVVSVHIYSRPIESCVAFDLEAPRCYRRQLRYFSKFGDVVMTPAEIQSLTTSASPAGATVRP